MSLSETIGRATEVIDEELGVSVVYLDPRKD